jgi:diacylglycerol kinase family enzyme
VGALTRRVAFIFNVHAGGGSGRAWLAANRQAVQAVAAGGPISMVKGGADIQAAVDQALAQQCDAVVAGGGDGTLNAVASKLVGLPTDFGVLPLGTLNHFAKDARLPLDPSAALHSIAVGHTTLLDVGEVNGLYFLNNSSIGLYVDVVRDRERQQTRLGRGKWPAFAWALLGALRRYPFLTVALTLDGQDFSHRTPFVFVGNNAYTTQGLQIGQRHGLCGGTLSVCVADRVGRWRLLALGLHALLGQLGQARDLKVFCATQLRIATRRHHVGVAIDGELRRLQAPLQFRIHPGALRVIVPAPALKEAA